MIVRSYRFFFLFFATALVGLAIIFGVLVFQLSRGPISLKFLTPIVERALDAALDRTRVELHDTVLTWNGKMRELDIRATDLRFLGLDGRVHATLPEVNVTFSASALMRGLVAPTNLELFAPRMKVIRAASGEVSIDFGGGHGSESGSAAPIGFVQELLRPPNRALASGYLSGIAVRSAFIEFEDAVSGRNFITPNASVLLTRNEEGIRADGSVTVGSHERAIHLGLSGIYRASSRTTNLRIIFSDTAPSAFAQFDPRLVLLERLDTRLDGTVKVAVDPDFRAVVGSLDLRASAGTIDAEPFYAEPVAFDSASFKLSAEQAQGSVRLEAFELVRGETKVTISGGGKRDDGVWATSWDAALRDLPINDIARIWPPNLEVDARDWITENVRDGHVDEANLKVSATIVETDPGSFLVNDIGAEIRFHDATVHYLRPMEPAINGKGVVRIDSKQIAVDIEQASLRDLIVESGRVLIDGLDVLPRDEFITIEATIAGPVRDALEVLNSEPLGFISRFGIDPARTTGSQRTNAVFAFRLINELTVDEIAVTTSSRLSRFSAESVAFGFPLSSGDLVLNVNREGLKARGTAEIGGIPVGLTWKENFNEGDDVRTQYEVRTTLDAEARKRMEIETSPYVTGPVGLELTYSLGWDGVGAGSAEVDLTTAAISLEPFGWNKVTGDPGRAFLRFVAPDENSLSLSEFQVSAGDLDATGGASFYSGDGGFYLRNMRLERLKFGENDAVVNVEMPEGVAPVISIGGNAVDLRPVMESIFKSKDGDEESKAPSMRIVVSDQLPIGSIRLGEETRLLNAHGTIFNDGVDWTQVNLRGALSNAGRVFLRISPEESLRRLTLETDDAGGLLRALDWVDTIRDGELRVRATIVGEGAEQVIAGQMDMQGFILTEEPFAAKLLALASLSGIGDVLGGEGITFRRAEVPFQITNQEFVIENAKARGAEIGIIVGGRINRETDAITFDGEVAPAYTLNSLLANIPLIGPVLSAGSDGIFAATFSVDGRLGEPNVSVNPLSVLTPGIIRKLLSGFDGDIDSSEIRKNFRP
ncbi:MAG: AsmA-like C-terminal domain-containing protein, partial [Alphaproteobacteria bacterium]|nr:AsmA-like C-terminal domain-containing protein [Alphaproteobacteria bacterium]